MKTQRSVSRNLSFQLIYLLLLCLFGFSVYSSIVRAEDKPVTVISPIVTEHPRTLRLAGSLTAEKRALLSPRMDGLVQTVAVDAGDKVKQGDLLLRLDSTLAQQQLQQTKAARTEAQAAIDEARRLVVEAQRLHREKYISATELATREANQALREAALAGMLAQESMAAEQVRRHDLPAPFDGVISRKTTEAGEWVNRGDQVLELVSLETVRIDVQAPQERFTDISLDSSVDIFPDALPGQQLQGRITAIVPVSNPQARSFLVRIVVAEPDLQLLPGTSATAVIYLKRQAATASLLIPRDAVLRHPDGGRSVFVVDMENLVQRRNVVLERETDDGILIASGLNATDQVVVRGNERLRENDRVVIVTDDR